MAKQVIFPFVNRNGRGYSFEVIRAKILYSDGARIKFIPVDNRNFNPNVDSQVLYSITPPIEEEDFGVSISTLVKQFEKEVEWPFSTSYFTNPEIQSS